MPTELVLLSERAVTEELMVHAVAPLLPGAAFISYQGGDIAQLVDADRRGVLGVRQQTGGGAPRGRRRSARPAGGVLALDRSHDPVR